MKNNILKLLILGIIWLFGVVGVTETFATGNSSQPPRIIRRKPVITTPSPSSETPKIIRRKSSKAIINGINSFKESDIVVVKPTKRVHVFSQSGSTVKKIAEYNSASYAINGAYFWREWTGAFYPAGTLGSGGKSSFNYSLCNDVNLCGIFNLDTLQIQKTMSSGSLDGNYRSSGPLLMWEGVVNEEITLNKSHRQRKAYRTALVYASQAPMFVFSKTGYTLPEFTLQLKTLFPAGNAINLDGGSSTSFYGPTDSFNSSKLLPEFFLMW
jgi:exopolysaccharide biosynthesis protein